MRVRLNFLLLFPIFSIDKSVANHDYTVTASSLYQSENALGGEATVITKDEINHNQNVFVHEVLREAPSIIMGGTGDNGRLTRFSMRGALGGENLILIDDIPVNDPSSSGGTFDFADMLVDDLEQVDILPGANSVIYGSDAMGGIVNMTTKSGEGKPKARTKLEGGSFRTGQGSVTLRGQEGRVGFAITGAGFRSGEGSFTNKVHGNSQGDNYRNGLGSGKLSYAVTPNIDLEGALRWNESKTRFDDLVGGLPVKGNNTLRTRRNVGHMKLHGSFYQGFLDNILRVSRSETRRKSQMPTLEFKNRGQNYKIHNRTDFNWSEKHISTLGGEYGWERVNTTFSGKHDRGQQAVFLQHMLRLWKGGELLGGIRFDHFEKGGKPVTYRTSVSQRIGRETRFRASYGTGFKAPLLSDQFNTSVYSQANPQLKPERSHSVDAGVDQTFLNNTVEINFTTFLNVISDVFVSQRVGEKTRRINGGRRVSRGIESKFRVDPCPRVSLRSNLTFVVAQDKYQGRSQRSPHVPRLVVNGRILYTPIKEGRLFVSTHYVSSQKDGAANRNLKPYTTLGVGGEADVTEKVQVYGRIENITDKRFEETYGFGVRGRAFYVGLKATL